MLNSRKPEAMQKNPPFWPDQKPQRPTADQVLQKLEQLKKQGVGIGNISQALEAITDSLIFLVDKNR